MVPEALPGDADRPPVAAADLSHARTAVVGLNRKTQRLLVVLHLQLDFGHALQKLGIPRLDAQCAFQQHGGLPIIARGFGSVGVGKQSRRLLEVKDALFTEHVHCLGEAGSGDVVFLPGGGWVPSLKTNRATEFNALCRGQMDRMVTDTRVLLSEGLKLASKTFSAARIALGWVVNELDQFIIHQVSKVHTDALVSLLGLDPKKVHAIYPEMGNIGPASVPIVLARAGRS